MLKINLNLAKLAVMLFIGLLFFTESVALEKNVAAFGNNLQNGNSISGTIYGEDRQPKSDLLLELQDDLGRTISRTKTQAGGRYSFRGLSAGRFNVRVLSFGTNYEEQTQSVEISNFTSISADGRARTFGFENLQLDFYLTVRKSSSSNEKKVTGTVFVQDVPDEAKTIFKKAATSFEKGSSEEGINYLKESLTIFPDYYVALEKLGREYVKLQKYEMAIPVLNKAVTVNPRSYIGWYSLALSNFTIRKFQEAFDASQKAVELDNSSLEPTFLNGLSLVRLGRYNEAETMLKKADKSANGTNADIHWHLALLYGKNLMKYDLAADRLELFLKAQPDSQDAERIKKLIAEFRGKAKKT
jgi:tetratricopeptide (TPR) repeat protein